MNTQMCTVVSKGVAATKTGLAQPITTPESSARGGIVEPTYNPPRHGRSMSSWISFASTTRKMRRLGTSGQNTQERPVQMHRGMKSDWVEDFPPLQAGPIASSKSNVISESRVLPAKDVKTPAEQQQLPSSSVVVPQSKRGAKKAKKMRGGGTKEMEEQDVEKEQSGSARRLRFGKKVAVRLFALDAGNENTLARVMAQPIGDDVQRIAKAPRPSDQPPKEIETEEGRVAVDRANDAIADWSFPINNSTIQSVTVDSIHINSDDSSDDDDTMELYETDELDAIFTKEKFDPEMFQRLPMAFNVFEQLPLMNKREWWYEQEKLAEESGKDMPAARTATDLYLGQDAIYAGMLKSLNDCGSTEYAIAFPIDIQLDYSLDQLRANVVRNPNATWILQPIVIQQHWILACYHPSTNRVIIHDSLYHKYTKLKKEVTAEWVQYFFDEMIANDEVKLTVKFARRDYSFHQEDAYNCGLYVLLHAQRFMAGRRKLVGRTEDKNINLSQERRNLLGLMRCMERYIETRYHYDDDVMQYDQHPIEWSHIRQIRRSPRDLTSQLQSIKACVDELAKVRCKAVRRKKRVSVPTSSATPTTAPTPGSPTISTIPATTSGTSSQGAVLSSTGPLSPSNSPLPNGSPPLSPPQSESPTDTLDSSHQITRRASKRRLALDDPHISSKRQRLLSNSDEDIDMTARIPHVSMQQDEPSARELRSIKRTERRSQESNGSTSRKAFKRRRRDNGDDKEEEVEGIKRRKLDEERRGAKRRSTDIDDDTVLKRRRDDTASDDEDRNVTRRRARVTRRRSSGASLIGSRQ